MTKTTRSKGEAGGSRDDSWRRGAALVVLSSILSSFFWQHISKMEAKRDRSENTTGEECLAVAVRPEGKRREREGSPPFSCCWRITHLR